MARVNDSPTRSGLITAGRDDAGARVLIAPRSAGNMARRSSAYLRQKRRLSPTARCLWAIPEIGWRRIYLLGETFRTDGVAFLF
jgi:hypothetical protein